MARAEDASPVAGRGDNPMHPGVSPEEPRTAGGVGKGPGGPSGQ